VPDDATTSTTSKLFDNQIHMKSIITATVLITGLLAAQAQERLPREEALKYACYASLDLKAMLGTPIPTDPDIKRPVAVKHENHGLMVLPEVKLSAQTFGTASEAVKPVGQLWLVNLAPMRDGQVVSSDTLRMVHVRAGDQEADASCYALGVSKKADGPLELLVYGKEKDPLLRVPLKSISAQQENPIEMSGEAKENSGVVTLKFVGKYEASINVTEPQ
jgi:hypothetical protein